MNQKIYDLMNWPEIEGIVYSECDKPSELLGGHVCEEGFLIQSFHPEAVEITVQVEGKKRNYQMEKVDEAGYFATLIPGKRIQEYSLTVENLRGKKETFRDPYAYTCQYSKKVVDRFLTGNDVESYKLFGAHKTRMGNVKGISFTVWAPHALRVSIVGEFNRWDGRIHQMNRLSDSGIFTLFIPDLPENTVYQYEIRIHGGRTVLKTDPYSTELEKESGYAAVALPDHKYRWQDEDWQRQKKAIDKESLNERTLAIYELDKETIEQVMSNDRSKSEITGSCGYISGSTPLERMKSLVSHVVKLGFTHVEIMPLCEYVRDDCLGYETLGYFGLSHRYGKYADMCCLIDAFHQASIGIIMDFNAAFMGTEEKGLCQFDGTALYENGHTNLGEGQTLSVASFDYRKPEIRSFILSAVMFWVSKYHLDGIRFVETASMLYLNYGKNPGEWIPNIYGGYENMDAVALISQLRTVMEKKEPGTLLIAQESSAWPKVTGQPSEAALGFDYKWNFGWKQDFLQFLFMDPLFRKGRYEQLISSMLYQYSENFILELSHKGVNRVKMGSQLNEIADKRLSLYDLVPGMTSNERMANVRVALAYLYFHPGKKLIYERLAQNTDHYIQALNLFYRSHEALYDQDNVSDGFSWIDNSSADETVIGFIRKSQKNQELLVVMNFTPVLRSEYRIGVLGAGKYKEIFNSDLLVYGGGDHSNRKVIKTEPVEWKGHDNSMQIVLPPMSAVVFSYEPYTEMEQKEFEIRQQACKAKAEAEARAIEAEKLRAKAEEDAKAALDAEKLARETARKALEAKEEAQKRAHEAEETSRKIEEEAKKKIAALRSRK